MPAALDTLKIAESLEATGMKHDTARVVAATVLRAAEHRADNAATREYVLQVALGIVAANAAITFGLLKMLLP